MLYSQGENMRTWDHWRTAWPASGPASSTTGSMPRSRTCAAAANPTGPPPRIATVFASAMTRSVVCRLTDYRLLLYLSNHGIVKCCYRVKCAGAGKPARRVSPAGAGGTRRPGGGRRGRTAKNPAGDAVVPSGAAPPSRPARHAARRPLSDLFGELRGHERADGVPHRELLPGRGALRRARVGQGQGAASQTRPAGLKAPTAAAGGVDAPRPRLNLP